MPVYEASRPPRPLVFGTRCTLCDVFTQTAEGGAVAWCHRANHHELAPLVIEHHLGDCLHHCGPACDCPCHEYRKRAESLPLIGKCSECGADSEYPFYAVRHQSGCERGRSEQP